MAEKILIIDDDIDTLKLVGLMLERQGYDIVVASNGQMGLAKAASEKPDLILLDVMMPDLDGYEVARRLRADPALAHIPIIMFTAKSMVDDKVAGFEAGADDYLTKPTHPAELTAHIKAVLARAAQTRAKPTPSEAAGVLGFLGARGGMGTTTLALNVGILLQQRGHDVIVAEMNPGHGTLALELKLESASGLGRLLGRDLKDIHLRSVESALVAHRSGIRLLPASPHPSQSELARNVAQAEAVVKNLSSLCTTAVLDLGAGLRPYTPSLIQRCSRVVLVVEPIYPSTAVAQALLQDLETAGFGKNRFLLALVTRMRTSLQVPWRQVQADLGIELAGIISPAPEQAHQASHTGTPVVMLSPESLLADQIRKLTDEVAAVLEPVHG